MGLSVTVLALLRRLRAERGIVALVFLVVALTTFGIAAAPRSYNRVADDALRYEASHASVVERDIRYAMVGRLPAASTDPLGRVADREATIRKDLPASVADLIDASGYVVDLTRFRVVDPPRFATYLTPRRQEDLERDVDLVGGRWPKRVPRVVQIGVKSVPVFEIAISTATGTAVGLTVGDHLEANVDPNDELLRSIYPRPTTSIQIDVVGTFVVRDPDSSRWFGDQAFATPDIGGTDRDPIGYATAVFAPEAYPDLVSLELPFRYRWNLHVDVDRLDASRLDTLVPDLRRLVPPFVTSESVRPGAMFVRTGLSGTVDRYLAQRATAEATLSIIALGPLLVAAAAIGITSMLVVGRRRSTLVLAQARGASVRQLLAAQLFEGLLITIPAALAGYLLALAIVPARGSELSWAGAILVALSTTVLLVASTWSVVRHRRRVAERRDQGVRRVATRRLVFEIVVVALSVVAAVLLRERGLAQQGTNGVARFDPLLAAVPALVGFAVALVLLRLYPIPLRVVGRLAARRRDLVPVLGSRTVGRRHASAFLPLLILTVTIALGTLSSVLQASVDASQRDTVLQEVGADYRIESPSGGALDPRVDGRGVSGVEAVAAGLDIPRAPMSTGLDELAKIRLVAVEPANVDAVLRGTSIATSLSSTLSGSPAGPTAGTKADPIPAIVSATLPAGSPDLAPGDRFELGIDGQTMSFVVIDRGRTAPGLDPDASFVMVSLGSIEAGWHGSALRPSTLYVRGSAGLAGAIRASAPQDASPIVVTARDERLGEIRDAPLVAGVTNGFGIALLVAVAYAALAVVAVFVLESPRRTRDATLLRTLGASDRQISLLTVVEMSVPLVLALIVGVALGLGLAWLVEPGIDLATLSSPGSVVTIRVDWSAVVAVSGAIVIAVALALCGASLMVRRIDLGAAVRIDEE